MATAPSEVSEDDYQYDYNNYSNYDETFEDTEDSYSTSGVEDLSDNEDFCDDDDQPCGNENVVIGECICSIVMEESLQLESPFEAKLDEQAIMSMIAILFSIAFQNIAKYYLV